MRRLRRSTKLMSASLHAQQFSYLSLICSEAGGSGPLQLLATQVERSAQHMQLGFCRSMHAWLSLILEARLSWN